eukprot:CCRYP_010516-RA/>CCRYP_010516-RA protein AED:0.00 eAED:0.00 QI:635/1/1/1/1/1/2/269/938
MRSHRRYFGLDFVPSQLAGKREGQHCQNEPPIQKETKTQNAVDAPPVWGLAPSADAEESEEPEPASPSIESNGSELELIYDNIELVLDESALRRAPTPPQTGRRSPFAANGMLKKKVSGIMKSGRYSPKAPASPPAVVAIADSEARSSTPTEDFGAGQGEGGKGGADEDAIKSQQHDLASFNGIPRLSPNDLKVDSHHFMAATAAALAAVKSSGRSSPKEKDSISGEIHENLDDANENLQNVEPVQEKNAKKKSKSSLSKSSKMSKSSASEKSKSSMNESVSDEIKKARSKSLPSSPSRKFLRGLPSFKRGKSVVKIHRKVAGPPSNVLEKKDTICLDNNNAPHNTESRKKSLFKKKSETSLPEPTNPTPVPAEVIEDAKHWKATLDKSTSKTYYFHSKTKVVTWDKPPGFDEAQKIKENKYWKATVDATTGKTYYYHSKTKEVTWTKPEGYCERSKKKDSEVNGSAANVEKEMDKGAVTEVDTSKEKLSGLAVEKNTVDKASSLSPVEKETGDDVTSPPANTQADVEIQDLAQKPPIAEKAAEEAKDVETVPDVENEIGNPPKKIDEAKSEPHTVERINSIEDAPFDELTPATNKTKDGAPAKNEDTFGPIVSMINNQVQSTDFYKSIDFSTRTKTFMSQLTDKTPKFNNTTSTIPMKDFTDTQIDVNITADAPVGQGSNANTSSLDSSLNSSAEDPPIIVRKTTANNLDVPVVSKQYVKVGAKKGAGHDEASVNDKIDDEESAVFDDWSDEVSDLSGIGNDERLKKTLLIGRNGKKSENNNGGRDRKTEKQSSRSNSAQNQSSRNSRDKNFTQQELDNFIAKNDWSSVSKYIAEMRNSKPKIKRSQPTRREIQEAIEYNQRIESNGNGPRKRFGAKSQMQHDSVDEFSDMSPAESESLRKSMSINSRDSSCSESGLTSFDESPRRRNPHTSRRRAT